MSPREDESTTKILIQIAGDIGRTREATETLKDNYATLTEDVKEIKDQLSKTVTTPECVEKHRQVSKTMEVVKADIIAEIKKTGTGTAHPAITAEMLKTASAPTVQEIEERLEERREDKVEKRRRATIAWLGIISTVSALLIGGAVGVYKVAVFANKLETMVATGNQEVRSEIKSSKMQKVIYVKVPIPAPDGDTFPPLPPKSDPDPSPKKAPPRKNK